MLLAGRILDSLVLQKRPKTPPLIIVILTSRRAEGTPRLTLDLCKRWRSVGIETLLVVLFTSPSDLAQEFDSASIRSVVLGWRTRGYWRYLKLLWVTFSLCRKHRPAAVLSMPLGWHLFVAIGAWLAGVRNVVAHVGNFPEPERSYSWWAFKIEVQLARPFTNMLVCCSEYVREGAIRAFGLRSHETVVISNGIDPGSWTHNARSRYLFSAGSLRLCMVGTLERHKDQATLIEAMPMLIDRASEHGMTVRLSIAGDGSRRRTLENKAARLGVNAAVKFMGTQKNISTILQETDVFVFSTTEYEGQGIALIEAMAAGLPIVASDVGACREVLANGQCGLLVEPHNAEKLSEAILRIALDRNLAKTLSEAARSRAHAKYSIVSTAKRYARICGVAWTST